MVAETRPRRVWPVLALPPFVFLAVLVAASIVVGRGAGGDARIIEEGVTRALPVILLVVQLVLLAVLALVLRAGGLGPAAVGWRLPGDRRLWPDLAVGSGVGVALGLLYPAVLAPLLETVQRVVGDYVPPGEILPVLGSHLLPFLVANVILAPFVEESLYRGWAMSRLLEFHGTGRAILVTSVFFGLLHWAGGFWYMVLTGGLLGPILGGLFVWRRNLVAPYTAHLVLNILEFLSVS